MYHRKTALLNKYLLMLYTSEDQGQVKHTMSFAVISLTSYAFFSGSSSQKSCHTATYLPASGNPLLLFCALAGRAGVLGFGAETPL